MSVTTPPEMPFTMRFAQPSRNLSEIDGEYNAETQQWSNRDISAVTTWSRSSTTGFISTDPDDDKDDK